MSGKTMEFENCFACKDLSCDFKAILKILVSLPQFSLSLSPDLYAGAVKR